MSLIISSPEAGISPSSKYETFHWFLKISVVLSGLTENVIDDIVASLSFVVEFWSRV